MAIDKILAKSFKFDERDLRANQEGRLSDQQRARFLTAAEAGRRQRPRTLAFVVIVGGIVVAIAAAQSSVAKGELAIIAGVMVVFVVLIALISTKGPMNPTLLEHAEVHVTDGTPTVKSVPRHPGWRHVTVGGVQFSMDLTEAKFFDPSTHYRIFYTSLARHFHQILSAETVDQPH